MMASKRIDIYFITMETNLAKTDHIVRKIYVVPMLWEGIWETTIIQIPNVIYGYSSIIFTLIKADVLFESKCKWDPSMDGSHVFSQFPNLSPPDIVKNPIPQGSLVALKWKYLTWSVAVTIKIILLKHLVPLYVNTYLPTYGVRVYYIL